MPRVPSFGLSITPGLGPPFRHSQTLSTQKPPYKVYYQRRLSINNWLASTPDGQLEANSQLRTIMTWKRSSKKLGSIPFKCVLYLELWTWIKFSIINTKQFTSATVSGTLDGKVHSFTFEYRDPWEWILSLVQDESLAPTHMWNSVQKYYCRGDFEERIYDEPNTADTWWAVDVSSSSPWTHYLLTIFLKSELPEKDEFPHCYLPLHFWLDKGLVTRRVSKYPMVLRPVWLPRRIRNASGNGGGVLVGYMPMVSFT